MTTHRSFPWRFAVPVSLLSLLGACHNSASSVDDPVLEASSTATATADPPKAVTTKTPSQDPVLQQTFDKAVSSLRDAGAISDMSDEDWAELEARFADRAAEARTTAELRQVMQEMIETLGKSHFAIIPQEAASGDVGDETFVSEGSIGLTARHADGLAIITAVDPGASAHEAGVRPGWQITSVRGRSVAGFFERFGDIESSSMAGYQRNAGLNSIITAEEGDTLEIEFIDLEGTTHEMELDARVDDVQVIKFGNLPPMTVETEFEILEGDELEAYGIDAPEGYRVGMLRFSVWMIPIMQPILKAIDTFRTDEVDAVIIDLRGNPGGVGGLSMGVGGHFFTEPVSLGTMTNEFGEMNFTTNPQRLSPEGELVTPLSTPLAILIDEMSASTSEIFAGGMQTADRAEIVGRRTPGMALPAVAEELPNGDILYHAIAEFTLPDGATIEGIGVSPDLPVTLTPASFEGSRDPDVRAAVELLIRNRTQSDVTTSTE